MCVHGCRLTGKMTGAVDQVSDCASVITLNSISVMTLSLAQMCGALTEYNKQAVTLRGYPQPHTTCPYHLDSQLLATIVGPLKR